MKPLTEGKTRGGMSSKRMTSKTRPKSPPPSPTSRKKAGVKVWYINHVYNELGTGILVSTEEQS